MLICIFSICIFYIICNLYITLKTQPNVWPHCPLAVGSSVPADPEHQEPTLWRWAAQRGQDILASWRKSAWNATVFWEPKKRRWKKKRVRIKLIKAFSQGSLPFVVVPVWTFRESRRHKWCPGTAPGNALTEANPWWHTVCWWACHATGPACLHMLGTWSGNKGQSYCIALLSCLPPRYVLRFWWGYRG